MFVDYENGTTINNFFEYLIDDPTVIDLDDGETITSTPDTITHTVTRTEDDGYSKSENVTWDILTGVMTHAYFSESDPTGVLSSEIELQRTDVTNPIDTNKTDTDDTVAPLPGMTYLWVFSALIAIPIIRKKNN